LKIACDLGPLYSTYYCKSLSIAASFSSV